MGILHNGKPLIYDKRSSLELRPTPDPRLRFDFDRLLALPIHRLRPQRLVANRKAGVLLFVPRFAVLLDCKKSVESRRGVKFHCGWAFIGGIYGSFSLCFAVCTGLEKSL